MKRAIVLVVLVLILGLSFWTIQCAPGSNKPPLQGLSPGTIEQLKLPPNGFY